MLSKAVFLVRENYNIKLVKYRMKSGRKMKLIGTFLDLVYGRWRGDRIKEVLQFII